MSLAADYVRHKYTDFKCISQALTQMFAKVQEFL